MITCRLSLQLLFQSTLPRGSDLNTQSNGGWISISIHAPVPRQVQRCFHFNPRSLAGATNGRRRCFCFGRISIHAPSRERPKHELTRLGIGYISIHAPSRERLIVIAVIVGNYNFNPRSLAGATMTADYEEFLTPISIHAPSRERQITTTSMATTPVISIHAPSRERRQIRRGDLNG